MAEHTYLRALETKLARSVATDLADKLCDQTHEEFQELVAAKRRSLPKVVWEDVIDFFADLTTKSYIQAAYMLEA